jgi:hypothetical protein
MLGTLARGAVRMLLAALTLIATAVSIWQWSTMNPQTLQSFSAMAMERSK